MTDRHACALYLGVVGLFLTLFTVSAFLLTIEADESWTMFSTLHAFGAELPRSNALDHPTVTTGGVHLVLHGLLGRVTQDMFMHRIVSLVSAGILLAMIYRILRWLDFSSGLSAAGTALFAAVPGFLLQASLALGEIIATALLIGACFHWLRAGSQSLGRAATTGVLLGLACATRINLLSALPALALFALMASGSRGAQLPRASLAIAVAILLFAAATVFYWIASGLASAEGEWSNLGAATGLSADRTRMIGLIQKLMIANGFLPLYLLFAACAAWYGELRREPKASSLCGLLILVGLFGLAAWVARAPIPHLRYAWPAIAVIWLVGVVQLLTVWIRVRQPNEALAIHGLVLAVCAFTLVADALSVAKGDSLTLAYQASAQSPSVLPWRRFEAAKDQRLFAAFMASQPVGVRFYTLNAPFAYPLTYLSKRTVSPVEEMPATGDRMLLLTPAHRTIAIPRPEFFEWQPNNAAVVAARGGFVALRLKTDAPPPPTGLHNVGDINQPLTPSTGPAVEIRDGRPTSFWHW